MGHTITLCGTGHAITSHWSGGIEHAIKPPTFFFFFLFFFFFFFLFFSFSFFLFFFLTFLLSLSLGAEGGVLRRIKLRGNQKEMKDTCYKSGVSFPHASFDQSSQSEKLPCTSLAHHTSGNRRSSEIQGTALSKCLQVWPVYTGPCLRV